MKNCRKFNSSDDLIDKLDPLRLNVNIYVRNYLLY